MTPTRSHPKEPVAPYTIKELSELYNVSYRTLRFYEEKKLLRPAHASNQRIYSQSDRTRLESVLLGKRFGFSLEAITQLMERPPANEKQRSLDKKYLLGLTLGEIEKQLAQLTQRREVVELAIDSLKKAQQRTHSIGG